VKSETKGPLAGSIELYLAHKRSLGKELAKVEPMLLLLDPPLGIALPLALAHENTVQGNPG
jgi:hypothetical protein